MGPLNYHHLYVFWMIAERGSLSGAAKAMHVTHSTLSVQLRALEDALGGELFERRGRGLVITPLGDETHVRASEIFQLGRDVLELAQRGASVRVTLRIGALASLPKTIVCRLVETAFDANVSLDLQHLAFDRLLEALAAGRLHAVLADQAPPQSSAHRLHSHVLGESELLIYGTARVRAMCRGRFPDCLQGAPMLLPRAGTTLRREIERWLDERELRVRVVGEVDDAGTMRAFGLRGHGLFVVRAALASEIADVTGARKLGTLSGLRERYVAITRERTVRHPALIRLIDKARSRLE